MLHGLLMKLMEEKVQTNSMLASNLGVSDGMLADMLNNLEKMGYLETLDSGCDKQGCSSCSGCSKQAACNNQTLPMRIITEKGMNLVKQ